MNLLDRVDPEFRELLRASPGFDLSDIAAARTVSAARWHGVGTAATEGVRRQDLRVTSAAAIDVPIRVYTPAAARHAGPLPCLVWIHGGGHVMGDHTRDAVKLVQIVEAVDCIVVSVDWRKAPEHPYPAEHDDCFGALCWVADHADRLGVDRHRLAVGGDSSGAGTAAGIALRVGDGDGPALAFQLLAEPMLDDRGITASCREVTDHRLWNQAANAAAWGAYLGSLADDQVPAFAAPARADALEGLPPAFVSVGEIDMFRDEAIEYARRLQQAGVPVELHVYPGAVHGFDSLLPESAVARRFAADRDAALARAFWGAPAANTKDH